MNNGHLLPSSLISEKFSSLGDFDQCLSLRNLPSHSVNCSHYYKGKYCLVHLTTPQIDPTAPTVTNPILPEYYLQQLSLKWTRMDNRIINVNGICIPSICTAREINHLIETRTYFFLIWFIHKTTLTRFLYSEFAQYLPGITIQVKNCQIARSKLTSIGKSDFSFNLAR